MPVLELLVGLAILVAVAVVASGRAGAATPTMPDRPSRPLPDDGPLTADDLAGVRFSVGLRGYRMDEVDALLDRLQAQLDPGTTGEPTEARGPDAAAHGGDAE